MDSDPKVLEVCDLCRLVHDERETMDCWVSKKAYQLATGIDPTNCHLNPSYCPACADLLFGRSQAA